MTLVVCSFKILTDPMQTPKLVKRPCVGGSRGFLSNMEKKHSIPSGGIYLLCL